MAGQVCQDQWRSQKFGLGGAIEQLWLKSLINIVILFIKGYNFILSSTLQ
jgi:hypothetical protein